MIIKRFNKDVVLADTEWLSHMNFEVFCDPITKKKVYVNYEAAYLYTFYVYPYPRDDFRLKDLCISLEEAKGLVTNTPFLAGGPKGSVFICMDGKGRVHKSKDIMSEWPFPGAFGSTKCNSSSPHLLLAIRASALTINIGGPEFIILSKGGDPQCSTQS